MVSAKCDVAVVGAGLVGLSLAFELAGRGAAVTVVDANLPGRATSAGAGILSPDTSAETSDGAFAFGLGAGEHYRRLIDALAAEGIDTAGSGYATCGLLSLCLRAHEEPWFAPFAERITTRSAHVVSEISSDEAQRIFPPLAPVHRALHCTSTARVDGRGMADALRLGAARRGVVFVDGTVVGITERSGAGRSRSVQSIAVQGASGIECAAMAVCGGAWSAPMGEWLGQSLPISPTKGQIVHLGVDGASDRWPIIQPLLTHYLVPWPDHRIACGGTFEVAAGFDSTVTAAGVHELLRECLSVAPGLANASYLETRVGLRPISIDDRPVAGALPAWDNVWVATGHGASGLLLGPYTAKLVAEEITGTAVSADADYWRSLRARHGFPDHHLTRSIPPRGAGRGW